eukprot:g5812.t2
MEVATRSFSASALLVAEASLPSSPTASESATAVPPLRLSAFAVESTSPPSETALDRDSERPPSLAVEPDVAVAEPPLVADALAEATAIVGAFSKSRVCTPLDEKNVFLRHLSATVTAQTIAEAVASGDSSAAASAIGRVSATDDTKVITEAASEAISNGYGEAIADAATKATKEGGDSKAIAKAIAQSIGADEEFENQLVDRLEANDAGAVAQAISEGGSTVVVSRSVAEAQSELKRVVSETTAVAIAEVQNGGDAYSLAEATAEAIGNATARAVAETLVTVEVEGSGSGEGQAEANANAVSEVVATAIALSFAEALGPDAEATSYIESEVNVSTVANATASATSRAQSNGGTAVAFQRTVSTAVAEVIVSAMAKAFALVSGGQSVSGGESEVSAEVTPGSTNVDSDSQALVEGKLYDKPRSEIHAGDGSALATGDGTATTGNDQDEFYDVEICKEADAGIQKSMRILWYGNVSIEVAEDANAALNNLQ